MDGGLVESSQPGRAAEEYAVKRARRISALAKELVPSWIDCGRIKKPPVSLTDEVYLPPRPHAGYQFCIVCGRHARFRLRAHITNTHKEFSGDDLEVAIQTSRGIVERMKKTKVDFSLVPEPITDREWDAYKAVAKQLKEGGIPIYMPYEREAVVRQRFLEQYPQMQHREEAQMGEDVETILANQLAATPVQQHIPQTFRGPFISRENEYRIAYDKLYTGGQNIHPHFLSKHYKELMFSYYDDDFARDYYVQDYTITADTFWMRRADLSTKLWRKLRWEVHPLLVAFRKSLQTFVHVEGKRPSVDPLKGGEHYGQYVERYMLVAMRGRQRCGKIVTIDDAIFSERMLPDFLEMTQKVGVTVGVRINFVKALIAFYKFLKRHIDANGGQRRMELITRAIENSKDYLAQLKSEMRSRDSYQGLITPGKPRKEFPKYGVMRVILDHSVIDKTVEEVMKRFARDPKSLICAEYNFVMSALIAYIMHCNATRNEVVYKTIVGSVVEKPDESLGLIKCTESTADGSEIYWVGRYPNPKQRSRTGERTACKSGLFVLDTKSHRWLKHYKTLRAFVTEGRGLGDMSEEKDPFFLGWSGRPVSYAYVRLLLKRFMLLINCEGIGITCNATRHASSTSQYQSYLDQDKGQHRGEPADKDVSKLLGHSQRTQLQYYVDEFAKPAVKAYRYLRMLADREKILFSDEVAAAKRRVKFEGFDTVAESLPEPDSDEESAASELDTSEDEEGVLKVDELYVPSKPTDNSGQKAMRKSPRKEPKLSPSRQVEVSDESSSDESATERRRKVAVKMNETEQVEQHVALKKTGSATEQSKLPRRVPLFRPRVVRPKSDSLPTTSSSSAVSPEHGDPYQFTAHDDTLETVCDLSGLVLEVSCKEGSDKASGSRQWQLVPLEYTQPRLVCRKRHMAMRYAKSTGQSTSLTAELLLLWMQSTVNRCLRFDTDHTMSSFDAFARSRRIFCPQNTDMLYPYSRVIPHTGSNQLCHLLWAAEDAAYRRKGTVVLVFKAADDQRSTVVLLGELAPPSTMYNSCVGYIDGNCYAVKECPSDSVEPTLNEEFGNAELLQFRTRNEDMWLDLIHRTVVELNYVLDVMRRYHSTSEATIF